MGPLDRPAAAGGGIRDRIGDFDQVGRCTVRLGPVTLRVRLNNCRRGPMRCAMTSGTCLFHAVYGRRVRSQLTYIYIYIYTPYLRDFISIHRSLLQLCRHRCVFNSIPSEGGPHCACCADPCVFYSFAGLLQPMHAIIICVGP